MREVVESVLGSPGSSATNREENTKAPSVPAGWVPRGGKLCVVVVVEAVDDDAASEEKDGVEVSDVMLIVLVRNERDEVLIQPTEETLAEAGQRTRKEVR